MGTVYTFCTTCFRFCMTVFLEEEMEVIKEEISNQVEKKIGKIVYSPKKYFSPKKQISPSNFEKNVIIFKKNKKKIKKLSDFSEESYFSDDTVNMSKFNKEMNQVSSKNFLTPTNIFNINLKD